MTETHTLLLKMRPSSEASLRMAARRVDLRPLYEPPAGAANAASQRFGAGGEPRWFLADVPADAPAAWDDAHARLADRLGVAETDILFAEPDLTHSIYAAHEASTERMAAVGDRCQAEAQDATKGQAPGPDIFAWHLGDDFSQLGDARDAVDFAEPRTRIAHLDTGYDPTHQSAPQHVARDLEFDFAKRRNTSNTPGAALDSSGHGTGTLGIMAGGPVPSHQDAVLGGAPGAEILPLRVAPRVVLLRTSAFAAALRYAADARCAVATMSMGGLPSRAWAEAVDDTYLQGLCLCAAAGNHYGDTPPRRMVYPARYPRVIGVCGVMANHAPYAHLEGLTMEGSYGPKSVMRYAMAAYTPNIPWAEIGCPDIVDLDGRGTSSATPQVAAAAAVWIEKYKRLLPQDWTRVEAVRHALFSSAHDIDATHFGNGVLRAHAALQVRPDLRRDMSPRSRNSFAFLRLITGLGLDGPTPRESMFNLEIAQRWLLDETLQDLVPDPDDGGIDIDDATRRDFMEALLENPSTSAPLRRHVELRYPLITGRTAVHVDQPAVAAAPQVPTPSHRKLRIYAIDPSLANRLDTIDVNAVTLKVRWESLNKGPIGEYLAVYDFDASGERHAGVDLDTPQLLAQDGWAPSEGNPQFHQQMVYAVAMKTIELFEEALGRPVLWRPKINEAKRFDDGEYVQRLRIKPHALHQANAFYSPSELALQFGYFEASHRAGSRAVPGSRIYLCLSHDIIAHETTHAIFDGLFRRLNEPTNPDVLALHEGFADIVALFQHFTLPGIVEREIASTRGDLEAESMLGRLALQFGDATTGRGALRDAIGTFEDGVWKRIEPDPRELLRRRTPHGRGAILVAAVFDAFLAIYGTRTADLVRLASGGTGLLPAGDLHPDLIARLAAEATKSAAHVLRICIRALDYLPPVDVTFFEFLRAMITADVDMVKDDRYHYRVAIVEAFRQRGIYPQNLGSPSANTSRTLSVDTLRWRGLDLAQVDDQDRDEVAHRFSEIVAGLRSYADDCLYLEDRETLFTKTRGHRVKLHAQLKSAFASSPTLARHLHLDPELDSFEVHELRRSLRIGPDGEAHPQVVVSLTQSKDVACEGLPKYTFRGGSTLIMDLRSNRVRYCIYKDFKNRAARQARIEAFLRDASSDPLRALCLCQEHGEPFAALHAIAEEGL